MAAHAASERSVEVSCDAVIGSNSYQGNSGVTYTVERATLLLVGRDGLHQRCNLVSRPAVCR